VNNNERSVKSVDVSANKVLFNNSIDVHSQYLMNCLISIFQTFSLSQTTNRWTCVYTQLLFVLLIYY